MSEAMKIDNVELGQVRPSKTNPRKNFDSDSLHELADNIKLHGIIQPLTVRPSWCMGKDDAAIIQINGQAPAAEFFEIVAGERRYRAAIEAELSTIPVIARFLSDQESLEIQLIENLQSADLDPFEEAEGYQQLLAMRGPDGAPVHTVETIHRRVGKSRKRIYYRLKLLRVPASLRSAVLDGTVGVEIAELVGSIPPAGLRDAAAEEILHPKYEEGPLNRRKARELIADNYMRSLAGAPFNQDDAQLVSVIIDDATGERIGGGACTDCPMRTGNMEAIIGKTKRPDVCTNPRCYMTKCDAQFSRLQTEAVKEGKKLLSETEAKEIFDEDGSLRFDSPFVKLTDKPDPHECPGADVGAKLPIWGKLLERLESKPSIYIARDPRGRIVELVDRPLAIEAVKLAAKQRNEASIFDSPSGKRAQTSTSSVSALSPSKADVKKREAAKFDLQVTLAALQKLFIEIEDSVGGVNDVKFLGALMELSILHAGHDGQWLVCKWLNLEPKKDKHNPNAKDFAGAIEAHAKDFPDKTNLALTVCLLLSQGAKFNGAKADPQFKKFAALFKIDIQEIERSLKAEKPKAETLKSGKKKNLSVPTQADKAESNHAARDHSLTANDSIGREARESVIESSSKVSKGQTRGAQKLREHRFEKIADNKYRCECGAFAVKARAGQASKGKFLLAKEYRGKNCTRSTTKVTKVTKPKPRKKAKAKRR